LIIKKSTPKKLMQALMELPLRYLLKDLQRATAYTGMHRQTGQIVSTEKHLIQKLLKAGQDRD
jgi:hypothetical protein